MLTARLARHKAVARPSGCTVATVCDPDNPYKTYRLKRLPPHPFCKSGLSAIEGVLAPTTHAFLYLEAADHGRHSPGSTLEKHRAGVPGPR